MYLLVDQGSLPRLFGASIVSPGPGSRILGSATVGVSWSPPFPAARASRC